MKTDAKVVRLNKVAPVQSPTSPAGRLPVALIQLRDKAAQQLKQAMQALFDNADDTLFEMADRASSNSEQNAFFEAMRDLRLKRKTIERGFLQRVFESFATLNQYEIGAAPVLDTVSTDALSLVHNDTLEENVALDTMVSRVMHRDGLALGHLTTRLNAVISKKLDDKTNPLGPRLLCEQFLAACEGLGVEIRVKLIILKLFEKHVLGDLDQLYADANQQLVEAGGFDPHDRLVLGDQALASQIHRDLQRGLGGALPVAGLQHVEPALLDRELDVLHVAIVLFELLDDGLELQEDLRQRLFHRERLLAHLLAGDLGQGLGRADAGDDVLALGVDEEFAVEAGLARGRVTGEGDAGGR